MGRRKVVSEFYQLIGFVMFATLAGCWVLAQLYPDEPPPAASAKK